MEKKVGQEHKREAIPKSQERAKVTRRGAALPLIRSCYIKILSGHTKGTFKPKMSQSKSYVRLSITSILELFLKLEYIQIYSKR